MFEKLSEWQIPNYELHCKGYKFSFNLIAWAFRQSVLHLAAVQFHNLFRTTLSYTRVGTLIVATIHLQLIQNRYMFRSFTVLHCSHQHCVQPVASDVEVVGYL